MGVWQTLPVVTGIPAINVNIANAAIVDVDGVNAIEIAGKASAGTVRPIILRKRWISVSSFQWQPCFIDIFDPFANGSAEGWFWLTLPLQDSALKNEEFAIYNPDDVEFEGLVKLRTVYVTSLLPTGSPIVATPGEANIISALNNIDDTLNIIRYGIPDALGSQSSANAINSVRAASTWLAPIITNVSSLSVWPSAGTLQRIIVTKPGVGSALTLTDGGAPLGGTWDTTVAQSIEVGARMYQNLVATTTGGTPAHLFMVIN